ncbi:spondin-1a [Morone saxatilis]|uniref:spondin-1a n=1 Tax=Morone saxatilis TaxID=34816 RepID=UPI0015E1F737|nr:spondin-1a [Morone saxatilis]
MTATGQHPRVILLVCFISTAACNMFAFTEEPIDRVGKSDGYCSRILRAQSNRKEVNTEFRLRVEGDPESYQPGSTYRVTLIASSPSYFRGFTLIALKEGTEGDRDEDYIGNFQIIDEEETQFMTNCPPAVTESTPRRRTSIQVFWTAPPSGSGCLLLKASIVQKRIIYFQDEGSLTKRMCEKESLYGDTTDKPLLDCCACGTAKYRVTFYGNWSEKIHPKDYPRRANHWSAIIGASHSKNYVLWEYGGFSSDGVKQVAEMGSPVKMEEEIRQKGDDVLTVIKMKAQWPAWQPLNVRAAPSAEFSVDRTRHIMSFLTMLGPSPDWNVGLSAEDLCTKECGWVQKVVQDLIPWDAGTDSGVTYESPNKPTVPQDKIRPLTSLDHPQSPFYDPEGGAITPVARVVVERIARKVFLFSYQSDLALNIDTYTIPCMLTPWSDWSDCSVTCGKGMRTRQRMLKSPVELGECTEELEQVEKCMLPECPIDCVMTEWTEWSECNKSCGKGHTIRRRVVNLEPQFGGDPCSETIQRKKCKIRKCNRGQANSDEKKRRKEQREKRRSKQGRAEVTSEHPGCKMRPWSSWTECTKLCGGGIQERLMTVKQRFKTAQLSSCKDRKEIRACNVHPC